MENRNKNYMDIRSTRNHGKMRIYIDAETSERDALSPSENFRKGNESAIRWRYPEIERDPKHHIYNFVGETGFLSNFKSARSILKCSEEKKEHLLIGGNIQLLPILEHEVWSGAPLQYLAFRVGDRVLPGLHAIALTTGDWAFHDEFYEWFLSSWLPRADVAAKMYAQAERVLTRTRPTAHFLEPVMVSLIEKVIYIRDKIRANHDLDIWLSSDLSLDVTHILNS